MQILEELQNWYQKQCDGEWEHSYGVSIETIDNPGWWVKIDLIGTTLENKQFTSFKEDISESNWIHCYVEEKKFHGAGDSNKLETILCKFVDWSKQ